MTPDDGLDSRLSAYLDGELDPHESAAVQELLESSPEARAELDRVSEARDMVRGLPLLDPPPDVATLFHAVGHGVRPTALSGPPRRRARSRAVVMGVVATAAFWGVVVSSPDLTAAVSPSLDRAVAVHSLVPDGGDAEAEMSVTETDMPAEVGGSLYLVHSERIGRGTHAVYSDGTRQVSVFEEPGRVDWPALPEGSLIDLDGSPGWHGTVDGYDVVVIERGRRVYTIVAEPAPGEMMDDVGVSMPADEPSVLDRIREASYDLTRVFGLRG